MRFTPDRYCPYCGAVEFRKNGWKKEGQQYICKTCNKHLLDHKLLSIPLEQKIENLRLAKKAQKYQDTNRIERKSVREHFRSDNAIAEYNDELIKALTKYPIVGTKHELLPESGAVGVIHASDLHFNELVLKTHNKYDFKIAAQRLKKYVTSLIRYFEIFKVKNTVFAMTGDLLNSDRRLDELLNQATNRANATILSVHLLKQVLEELSQHFNINVACVTGNESRAKQEDGWSNIIATDNYDFTIFSMLKYIFMQDERFQFIMGDPTELVINVAGHHWLLLHGHSIKKDVEKSIQQVFGKYATRGIILRHAIFGHLHSARVGDYFSRSSSLVGDNDYSDKGLQLAGRASQNAYVAFEDGSIDSIKIDLQYVDCEGYKIIEELEAYNAKSAGKLRENKTIFEIVV